MNTRLKQIAILLAAVALAGCGNSGQDDVDGSDAPSVPQLSPEDKKLDFGSEGISVITAVDDNDPTKVLIDGPTKFESGRMVPGHTVPGAVVIVGVKAWAIDGDHYKRGHVLLRNSEGTLILAPPGTEITVAEAKTVLDFELPKGKFVVPADSKLPRPAPPEATSNASSDTSTHSTSDAAPATAGHAAEALAAATSNSPASEPEASDSASGEATEPDSNEPVDDPPASTALTPLRTWTDTTGKFKTEARLVEINGETVSLQKEDGSKVDVPVSRLSVGDRVFLAVLKKFTGKPDAPQAADGASPRDRWVGRWEAVEGRPGWKESIGLYADGSCSSYLGGRITASPPGNAWQISPTGKPAYFRLSLHNGMVSVTARLSDDGATMYVSGGSGDVPFKLKVSGE